MRARASARHAPPPIVAPPLLLLLLPAGAAPEAKRTTTTVISSTTPPSSSAIQLPQEASTSWNRGGEKGGVWGCGWVRRACLGAWQGGGGREVVGSRSSWAGAARTPPHPPTYPRPPTHRAAALLRGLAAPHNVHCRLGVDKLPHPIGGEDEEAIARGDLGD